MDEYNAHRTIDKSEDVLRKCSEFFDHQARMNAAAHMSERVVHSPLYASIISALNGISTFREANPHPTESDIL